MIFFQISFNQNDYVGTQINALKDYLIQNWNLKHEAFRDDKESLSVCVLGMFLENL